ncbi:MAG: glycosyltransferase family 39 protein [Candidatus Sumerlaeota bacterium]|nr:glycosyltransferase family 39 protein [Candidatus Sumerlaeota bacterium]
MNEKRISNDGQKGYIDKILIIILLSGILYKILFLLIVPDETEDAFLYVRSAENALRRGFREGFFFGRSEHFLYTLFLYLTTLIFRNGLVAGKALSVLFSTLTIIITYKIGVRHFSRKCALYAVFLLSFIGLGHLLHAVAVLSEPVFMFFAVLSFMIYLDKRNQSASGRWARFAAGGLVGIIMAISFWVRVEAGLLCMCYFLFYLVSKRWRELISFLLIAAPFAVLRYLAIPKATMTSVTDILGARFGANYGWREFLSILWNNTGMLIWHFAGDSLLLAIVFILILCAGMALYTRLPENLFGAQVRNYKLQTRHGFSDAPILPFTGSPILTVLTFVIINLLGISSMKYYRMHPSVYRHFTYLAPFLALLLGMALESIESVLSRLQKNLFGTQVSRWRGLQYIKHISRPVAALIAIILVAFSVPGRLTLSYKIGFLWRYIHYQDPHKAVGKWLRENLQPGDGVIFTLPTDAYYSRLRPETNRLFYWSRNRYDYLFYKKNKIRYVVWSDIQTDMNSIGTLGLERDFLFFRHRYSPPRSLVSLPVFSGWRSVIYEIVPVPEENLYPTADYGKGFTIPQKGAKVETGRRFYTSCELNIISDRARLVKTSFTIAPPQAGRLKIYQHGSSICEIAPVAKRPRRVTFLAMAEGPGVTVFALEYQPASHLQISHLKIEEVPTSSPISLRWEMNATFDDGWYSQEEWGRWMRNKAKIKIDLPQADSSESAPGGNSEGYVLFSALVKSYKVDRDLTIFINGETADIFRISRQRDFKNNLMRIEKVWRLKRGVNTIEFRAAPDADTSMSFEETKRPLTLAFHALRIVRIK